MGTCSKLQTIATEHRSIGTEAKWREAKCEWVLHFYAIHKDQTQATEETESWSSSAVHGIGKCENRNRYNITKP